ncbi:hypothetical protein ACFPM0_03845 [Pseudonocardia sulfidoxydans]|uniref:hypothetical protein n=1 Tax=Pseudonocardia sulfidoxydans TaxID=54011 RepID=UPI00361882E6
MALREVAHQREQGDDDLVAQFAAAGVVRIEGDHPVHGFGQARVLAGRRLVGGGAISSVLAIGAPTRIRTWEATGCTSEDVSGGSCCP